MGRERYDPREQQFYRQYLNSPQWRARKTARIAKAGGRCEFVMTRFEPGRKVEERCHRTRYLCVHHNTYDRLGCEQDRDLDVYCWFHHTLEHMLWKKCRFCGGPAAGDDEKCETALLAIMGTFGINLDVGPVNWKQLPNKEVFMDQLPPTCFRCSSYIRG